MTNEMSLGNDSIEIQRELHLLRQETELIGHEIDGEKKRLAVSLGTEIGGIIGRGLTQQVLRPIRRRKPILVRLRSFIDKIFHVADIG